VATHVGERSAEVGEELGYPLDHGRFHGLFTSCGDKDDEVEPVRVRRQLSDDGIL
jgi:hypothetical protein